MNNSDNEIWLEASRSASDLAGVFEFDGETCYFYLYDMLRENYKKIVDSIHITSRKPDFGEEDLEIRWSHDETVVGLFVYSQLWAAFDIKSHSKYGGNYCSNAVPAIPSRVTAAFA